MRKEKMLEKGFSFHYFEENDPYRIERSPVITGDLKNNALSNHWILILYTNHEGMHFIM